MTAFCSRERNAGVGWKTAVRRDCLRLVEPWLERLGAHAPVASRRWAKVSLRYSDAEVGIAVVLPAERRREIGEAVMATSGEV